MRWLWLLVLACVVGCGEAPARPILAKGSMRLVWTEHDSDSLKFYVYTVKDTTTGREFLVLTNGSGQTSMEELQPKQAVDNE